MEDLSLERQAIALWYEKMAEQYRTKAEFAQAMGVSSVSGTKFTQRGTSYKTAQKRADKMGWPLPDLMDLLKNLEDSKHGRPVTLTLSSIPPSAGLGTINQEEILTRIEVPETWLQAEYPKIKDYSRLALCTPNGSSMEPTFYSGDTLIVDRTVNAFDSDDIYVFSLNDRVFIKRIQLKVDGTISIISDNKTHYPTETVPPERLINLQVMARVIGKFAYTRL